MELKEGLIVWLKSGGPKMSVKFYHTVSGLWRCTWFDDKNSINEAGFKGDQLTDVDPNPKRNKGVYFQ